MSSSFLKTLTLATSLVLVLVCADGLQAGGPFVGPKEGPPSFRRDKLPLEVADIRRLSDSLVLMGTTINDDRAEDRRLAAQCIALSLALEPGNRDARRLLKAWEEGRYRPRNDFSDLRKALKFCADLIDWLESESAGRDAGLLAACLRDVVSRVGSSASEYRDLGEQQLIGDWNNFVPALAAYEKPQTPENPDSDPGLDPDPVPDPDQGEFKLAFDHAEITIPMWQRAAEAQEARDGQNRQDWVLKPGRMFIKAEYDPGRKSERFEMQVGDDIFNEQMRNFSSNISGVLNQAMSGLPGGLRVRIGSESLDAALRSGQAQSISAAAVVLAGSLIRGTPPDPDVIVIGRVDQDGNYLPSSDMWEKLKVFNNGEGQKLVVPAKSRQFFEAMLTMDQIKYFLDYQVVSASNVKELLDATSSQPEGGLGEACKLFAEIQKVAPEENQLRGFVANSHVRERLQQIVKISANHLSGEIMLMQAKSSRPFSITREVLCAEMTYLLKPLEQVRAIPWDAVAQRDFKRLPVAEMVKECRKKVATLERYVAREDRDLYKGVDAVFDEMREYDKALNARGEWDYITGLLARASRNAERVFVDYKRQLEQGMGR